MWYQRLNLFGDGLIATGLTGFDHLLYSLAFMFGQSKDSRALPKYDNSVPMQGVRHATFISYPAFVN